MEAQEKRIKACEQYKSKLKMTGKDVSSLFREESEGIEVDILSLAQILNYPEVLHIPNFVKFIRLPPLYGMDSLFFNVPPAERAEQNVQRIIVPDGVIMDKQAYKALNQFSKLKSISVSAEQYNTSISTHYIQDIRF